MSDPCLYECLPYYTTNMNYGIIDKIRVTHTFTYIHSLLFHCNLDYFGLVSFALRPHNSKMMLSIT